MNKSPELEVTPLGGEAPKPKNFERGGRAGSSAPPEKRAGREYAPPVLDSRDLLIGVGVFTGAQVVVLELQAFLVAVLPLLYPVTISQTCRLALGLAGTVVAYGAALGAVALACRLRHGERFLRVIGLHGRLGRGRLALAFLVGVGVAAPALFLEWETPSEMKKITSTYQGLALLVPYALVCAPFLEESFFRGFLFSVLSRQAPVSLAVAVVAAAFAVIHVPQLWPDFAAMAWILGFSVVLTIARAVTGSTTFTVLVHLAYNATLIAATFLMVYLGGQPLYDLERVSSAGSPLQVLRGPRRPGLPVGPQRSWARPWEQPGKLVDAAEPGE